MGKDITVTNINITEAAGCVDDTLNTTILNGEEATFNINCTLTSGYKLNSDLVVTYDEVGGLSGFTSSGILTKKVA